MESRRVGRVLGLVAVLMLALGCASASAASPVLKFETPGSVLPVPFTAEGGAVTAVMSNFSHEVHCTGSAGTGAITGPRSATGRYVFTGCEATAEGGPVHCQSQEAAQDEIRTPPVEAELVFIDQARREVGILLAPDGGVYMSFECAGESVEGIGPFLSPLGPLNQESSSFTASLSRLGSVQFPAEYESADGLRKQAIPTAKREGQPSGTTGVELSFAIHTSVPLTVRAVSAAEVEAEDRRRDEEAAARKRQDDEEAAKAAAARKHGEEEATKKRLEEEAEKRSEEKRAKEKARGRQRSKALKQCRKNDTKVKRVRCERRAKKRFAPPHPHRRY